MSTTLAGLASTLLYLAATLLLGARLSLVDNRFIQHRGSSTTATAMAFALHTLVLYHRVFTPQGLNFGFFSSMSLVSWVIVVLLFVTAFRKPVENLGLFTLPLAAVAVGLSVTFHGGHYLPRDTGFGLETHITLAILAYSLITIAAVQSVLLAFQDYKLRNRHPGGIMRALPPLQTMESLLFQIIWVGFFMLSLAVISGMMFLDDMFAQKVAHKTVLSLIAWLIFAILLWGRWQFGWRGRVAIRWSLAGFVALMLAFFGSKMVLELILGR